VPWQNMRLQTVRAGFNARFGEQEIYDGDEESGERLRRLHAATMAELGVPAERAVVAAAGGGGGQWRNRADFPSNAEYGAYIQAELTRGVRLAAPLPPPPPPYHPNVVAHAWLRALWSTACFRCWVRSCHRAVAALTRRVGVAGARYTGADAAQSGGHDRRRRHGALSPDQRRHTAVRGAVGSVRAQLLGAVARRRDHRARPASWCWCWRWRWRWRCTRGRGCARRPTKRACTATPGPDRKGAGGGGAGCHGLPRGQYLSVSLASASRATARRLCRRTSQQEAEPPPPRVRRRLYEKCWIWWEESRHAL
jgi:hypothetical protein